MIQHKLTSDELRILREALEADCALASLRLREGEYQHSLAKVIASFQLELYIPDVKDIISRLFDEDKTRDIQFVRKIQTILKKMEKSQIVRILPKKRPWDLQRYALLSFKFLDSDKNLVVFADEQQIKQAQDKLRAMQVDERASIRKMKNAKVKICLLIFLVLGFYAISVWFMIQPIINIFIVVPAISSAVVSSILLGKALSRG